MIGPLLSPPDVFPITAVTTDSGKATKSQIEKALNRFGEKQALEGKPRANFGIDEAITVMLDLGLCCQVQEEENVYYIPSLIKEMKPSGVWKKKPEFSFYRGRKYRVRNVVTDIVPPPVFSVLQSRCSVLSGYCILLWKDGLKLESDGDCHTTECLVEMTAIRKSIDVVVRCCEGDHIAAETTLTKVIEAIEVVRDERSPGTPMEWCYLSTEDLQEHNEDVAIYNVERDFARLLPDARIRAERGRDGTFPCVRSEIYCFPFFVKMMTEYGFQTTRRKFRSRSSKPLHLFVALSGGTSAASCLTRATL